MLEECGRGRTSQAAEKADNGSGHCLDDADAKVDPHLFIHDGKKNLEVSRRSEHAAIEDRGGVSAPFGEHALDFGSGVAEVDELLDVAAPL